MNARELDKLILGIIREMQPISSENVWLEITEISHEKTTSSPQDIKERLQKMKMKKILRVTRLKGGKDRYELAKK